MDLAVVVVNLSKIKMKILIFTKTPSKIQNKTIKLMTNITIIKKKLDNPRPRIKESFSA